MPLPKSLTIGKLATANIVLVANAFVWYLLAFSMLKDLLQQANATFVENLVVIGINTGAIAISGLIGSFFFDKSKNRQRFFLYWIAIGVVLSIVPLGINLSSIFSIAVISALFGTYFGLGMPATMGYHAEVTKIEDRGKYGGLAFLIIGIISSIAGLVIFDSLLASCFLLAFIRLLGLAVFYLQRKEAPPQEAEPKVLKYRNILLNKSFIFYFVPWCMFTLINSMLYPIQRPIFEAQNLNYTTLMAAEYIITAVFAVISGFIADKLGRKRLAIIGFIMLGIGYAAIGVFPISYLTFSGILYFVADGIAWGIFYVLFIFSIWGDLAQGAHADKVYLLGALPFISSYFLQGLFGPFLTQSLDANNSPTVIFSFASIFLFLSVLPLIYAPETLPEKVIKDRDLKSYIESAKKKAVKEVEKNLKKAIREKSVEPLGEPNSQSEEHEKAKALAEKYY